MKFIFKLIINMMVRLLLLASFLIPFKLFASEDFTLGAKHYLAKEYTESAESFKRAAASTPSSDIFLNLGLAEYQLAHYGLALSYWRKALDLSPWNSSAKEAINHLLEQNKLRRMSEDHSLLQKIHDSPLRYFSLHFILLFTLGLWLLGMWPLLTHFGRRRKSYLAGEVTPNLPIKVGVYLSLFLVFTALALLKYYDIRTLRVTVVVPSSPLRAGPTDESASVLEVFEGQELVVQRLDKDWIQVTYAGKTTGWIESKAAVISSGGTSI